MFMQHNGTESITATILSQWEHVCCYTSECQWHYCRKPTPPPTTSPIPRFLHKHAHASIHASARWCAYTRWLRLYSLVRSFEEPPPWTAESISFALIISHKCCVWLWCPRLLYARDASYRSPCVTYNQLWNWSTHSFSCVNKYRRFSHIHNIWGFRGGVDLNYIILDSPKYPIRQEHGVAVHVGLIGTCSCRPDKRKMERRWMCDRMANRILQTWTRDGVEKK